MSIDNRPRVDTELLRLLHESTASAGSLARRDGRPFLTLTYAQSVDGCITLDPLRPMALSGRESLLMTHTLRSAHDAILVGIRTVIADDPRLSVRLVDGDSPLPVVVDTHLSCPLSARLLKGPRTPLIAAGHEADRAKEEALVRAGATVMRLPCGRDGWIDLAALAAALAGLGIGSLMVEGGSRVLTSFLKARLADQMVITIAPVVVGGVHAFGRLALAPDVLPRLTDIRCGTFGDDLVMWGRPSWNSGPRQANA